MNKRYSIDTKIEDLYFRPGYQTVPNALKRTGKTTLREVYKEFIIGNKKWPGVGSIRYPFMVNWFKSEVDIPEGMMFEEGLKSVISNLIDSVFVIYNTKKNGGPIPDHVDVDSEWYLALKKDRLYLINKKTKKRLWTIWNDLPEIIHKYLSVCCGFYPLRSEE